MATQDTSSLLVLAKAHLGYPGNAPDVVVPHVYIDELRLHVRLYPHGTNFRLTLEPGKGFGKVTCIEQGCNNLVIPLVTRFNSFDGGLSEGLGSLSAYRRHLQAEHPTHANNTRDSRREPMAVAVLGPDVHAASASPLDRKIEQSRLLNALDSPFGFSSSGFASTQPSGTVSEYPGVKPEPTEMKVSRSLFGTGFAASAQPDNHKSSSLVRIKQEPAAVVSLSGMPSPIRRDTGLVPAHAKPEVTEALLPQKRSLDVRTNQPTQNFPVTPDVKRRKLEDIPGNLNIPDYPFVNQVAPGNVEAIRASISAVQDEIITEENNLNRLICKKKPTKGDLERIETAQTWLASLRRRKDDLNASLPSVSPLKKTLSKSQLSVPLWEDKVVASLPYNNPFQRQAFRGQQPIASGSNVCLSAAYNSDDDDDDMGVDPHEYNDDLALDVLQRVDSMIPEFTPFRGFEHCDHNGDFFGRGRDTFVGPQAKADDIDKFLIEAGNAAQFDGNARLDQALEKLGLQSQYDLLPGMEVALMPHQTIGVAWMIEKEKSYLKGGCLADDMGLGKTVQMIATLVKNRSENPMCKTSLIVSPTALLDQWKLELELKTNCNLQCLIYHGSTRPKRKQDLLRYDVILTTYSTMALEWPDHENETKKQAKAKAKAKKKDDFIVNDSEDEVVKPKKKQEQGLLFQVEFFRIVLDEAQSIRNRKTRTSRAVTDLQATYRWCLTGTPIVNSLVDAYGYLRFLKVRPWYDWEEFQRHIGRLEKKRPNLAVSRLQATIATFLLRRMKDTTMDGKRLIELPEKKVSLVKLQFSEEERDVYKMVEAGAQANFNRFLKAGTVLKNYSQVLVLLLRLRQVCSHPSLIQEGGSAFTSPDEADEGNSTHGELTRARKLVSAEFVEKMKAKFKDSALQRMEAEKQSADATVEDEECPICFDVFTDAVVTPCTHVFCRECIVDVLNTPPVANSDEPNQYKATERPCPTCRGALCAEKLFSRIAFLPSDAELSFTDDVKMEDDSGSDRKGKDKGKAISERSRKSAHFDSEPYDDDDNMSDFIVEDDEDEEARSTLKKRACKRKVLVVLDSDDETPEEKEVIFGKSIPNSADAIKLMPKFLPSTKIKYMMERLSKLLEERPNEKTLVVSQWTTCLSLVSNYLTERGVIHVKYQGDMNRAKRDQAVRVFMSKDKARVMLMSLKCGGVGLNLTRANNVISLDLGWSQAIEAQSFDRVHRLGQTRPVDIQRLVISDTVEDRVLAMQERKQQLADGSLGEGSGKKIGRLTVKELANLFGLDHRGRLLHN